MRPSLFDKNIDINYRNYSKRKDFLRLHRIQQTVVCIVVLWKNKTKKKRQEMTTANLAKVRDAKLWVIQYELTIVMLPRGIVVNWWNLFIKRRESPFREKLFLPYCK